MIKLWTSSYCRGFIVYVPLEAEKFIESKNNELLSAPCKDN